MLYPDPYDNLKRTDHNLDLSWQIAFKNQAIAEVQFANEYIFLKNDFDPTHTPGERCP